MDIYAGIDVSKDWLDVRVAPSGEAVCFRRDADDLDELVAFLEPQGRCLAVVEATGGFETVVTVNPAQVRAFAFSLGQPAKTDKVDARMIALFAQAVRPAVRALPDAQARELADLVGRQRQIIAMIVAERQREHRASPRMKKSITRLVRALEKELSSVDGGIDKGVGHGSSGSPPDHATAPHIIELIDNGLLAGRLMRLGDVLLDPDPVVLRLARAAAPGPAPAAARCAPSRPAPCAACRQSRTRC